MSLAEWSDKPSIQNQDDMFFPLKVRERYGVAIYIDGGKFWSRCVDFFNRHRKILINSI